MFSCWTFAYYRQTIVPQTTVQCIELHFSDLDNGFKMWAVPFEIIIIHSATFAKYITKAIYTQQIPKWNAQAWHTQIFYGFNKFNI